ncbi:hypothetical protein JZ751_018811 [Albula glossodonta]|uniref:Uncharacterized protein n=1 Tax=Albula glossodonta TaxID=121402 RepID=A0A8T2NMZ9_9TELE|nr:hypothetical protein JZ751_018811 [Albula glossodonta]
MGINCNYVPPTPGTLATDYDTACETQGCQSHCKDAKHGVYKLSEVSHSSLKNARMPIAEPTPTSQRFVYTGLPNPLRLHQEQQLCNVSLPPPTRRACRERAKKLI